MKLKELNELIKDEDKCEDYLRSAGILKTFTSCTGCGSTSLGMIRGDRYRCYSCKKEWSRRKDSILSLTRFSYSEFLVCLKYFALESSAEMVAEEFDLNYKTVRMLLNYFRMRIGDVDETTLDKFEKIIKGDTETLGLNYIDGNVRFELEHTADDEARVKAVRHRIQNSAAYYDITYDRLKQDIKLGKGEGYLSELDRFWKFASERLIKYRGTEQKYFILFLKELEFRYNHLNGNMYEEIVAKLR